MTVQVRVVKRNGEYRHECGRTVNGLYWLPVGCHHLSSRDAIEHADYLDQRTLGASGEGSTVDRDVPPAVGVRSEPSPESPRGDSRFVRDRP